MNSSGVYEAIDIASRKSCYDEERCSDDDNACLSAAEREALIRNLRRFTRDRDSAEDCFQTAYVRLEEYRRDHVVHSEVRFLARAARNIAIDEARKVNVRTSRTADIREILLDAEVSQPLQDEVLIARERLTNARAVLENLPERTCRIFMMHRFTRAKYREIAQEFDISVSAVEKHIAKAAQALAESIDQEDKARER